MDSADLVFIQTVFTGFLVLLTLAYVVITRGQLAAMRKALAETQRSNKATEKSNEIAERGLELGKRAWLVANLTTVSGTDSSALAIEIHNVGGIPATQVTIWHRSDLWHGPDLPEKIAPTEGRLPDVGIVVGAGRNHLIATDPIPSNTDEDIEAIENRQAVRYYYCEIDYSDVFDKPRRTVACWQFGPDRSGEWDWTLAPKHNRLE